MTPPADDAWRGGAVTLTLQPDGTYAGTLRQGLTTYHVRNWRRPEAGVVAFEWQPEPDPWFEGYLARIASKVSSG